MNLKSQLSTLKNDNRNLTLAERAELGCRLAKQLEKAGEYEAAREALDEFWPKEDTLPEFEGLAQTLKGELLLRLGAVAGWLGGAAQTEGSQETAKDLITKSIEIFESLGQRNDSAEARGDLALCYWREGSFDEARIHLSDALTQLKAEQSDRRAVLLIRAGIIEERASRLQRALNFYNEAAPIVEHSNDDALKGSFHFEYGLVFISLSAPENREDYLDKAFIEYAAASFHFDQAENTRAVARVENNLGYLYFTIGQHKDAHNHLDRARHLFHKLKDIGAAAQVDETRARTLLAQGHVTEAERLVRAAVRVLERGGQQAVLAEALATHGVALARLGNDLRARSLFDRSIEVAETAGDLEGAGRAKLSIIEELGEKIPARDLVLIYRSAISLLRNSQDPLTAKRLVSCADILFDLLGRLESELQQPIEHSWEGFSLKRHVKASESTVIERALRDAGGSVSKAAKLLGFKHHQSLISLLNSRHKELLNIRSVARKRHKHIVDQPRRRRKKFPSPGLRREASEMSILHVSDPLTGTCSICEALAAKGWSYEHCSHGDVALRKLTGKDNYNALVIDNNLPGLSGVELVERVRHITHRRRVPIVMLSSDDLETEAWRAGVDAFLMKPRAVEQVSSTLTRLLAEHKGQAD